MFWTVKTNYLFNFYVVIKYSLIFKLYLQHLFSLGFKAVNHLWICVLQKTWKQSAERQTARAHTPTHLSHAVWLKPALTFPRSVASEDPITICQRAWQKESLELNCKGLQWNDSNNTASCPQETGSNTDMSCKQWESNHFQVKYKTKSLSHRMCPFMCMVTVLHVQLSLWPYPVMWSIQKL